MAISFQKIAEKPKPAAKRGRLEVERPTLGDEVISWIETYCKVPEGRDVGKPVILRPWQRDWIKSVFDTPTRLAILSMGRKNGKSSIIAMLVLCAIAGPLYRLNSQIISTARSRDQAAVVFDLASKMILMDATLSAHIKIIESKKTLFCEGTGCRYIAVSADAKTNFGKSPVLAIHDELGQVRGPNDALYDSTETAMGAHENPLSIVISTQAPTDADLLSILIDDALAGHDPAIKCTLHAIPDETEFDIFDPDNWHLANPALGDFCSLPEMRQASEKAARLPSFENTYRNLHCNQRISATQTLLARSVWEQNAGEPDLTVFENVAVYGGLDLSAKTDLTAFVLVARDEMGFWHVWPKFWTPADTLAERAKTDRAPYDVWVKQGYLTAIPGKVIDYENVITDIAEMISGLWLEALNYDRWRIDILKKEAERADLVLPLQPFGQGFRSMSPAIETLEDIALNGRLRHGNNPVLNFCAANCSVTTDPAGSRKPDKARSTGRIDGMVALLMALAAGATGEEESDGSGIVF